MMPTKKNVLEHNDEISENRSIKPIIDEMQEKEGMKKGK